MDNNTAFVRPRFLLGKITNKYIIVELLVYAFEDYMLVFTYLHSSSKALRQLLKENLIAVKNILIESHLEMTIAQTFNYKTSVAAHLLLE
jgi:hypothetical protein